MSSPDTPPVADIAGSGRRETPRERLDRNLNELYSGLRVMLPGVQVLFAFLLVLPFQQRFTELSGFEKRVYFGTLISTAIALVLLIAPAARQRILFRRDDKAFVVFTANRLAIWGLSWLGVAMCGAVLLMSDVIFGGAAAVVSTTGVAALLVWFWFASPLLRKRSRRVGAPNAEAGGRRPPDRDLPS